MSEQKNQLSKHLALIMRINYKFIFFIDEKRDKVNIKLIYIPLISEKKIIEIIIQTRVDETRQIKKNQEEKKTQN